MSAAVAPTLREVLREAYEHNDRSIVAAGFQALAVHRFLNWVVEQPALVRIPLRFLGRMAFLRVRNVYGIELPASVRLGRRFRIAHQGAIVIHANAVFGDDCMIRQGVTIGAAGRGPHERDHPTIGDRVTFGAGAVVVGRLTIGDDVTIGPNTVVMSSVPAGSYVVAPASRTIARTKAGSRTGAGDEVGGVATPRLRGAAAEGADAAPGGPAPSGEQGLR